MKTTRNEAMAVFGGQQLPDLSKAQVAPIEMIGEYWSPTQVGETKRVFFVEMFFEQVIDPASGENRELGVVKFVEQTPDGLKVIRNGSRRLFGVFEALANKVKAGDAFEITYLGEKKNKNNSFKSANWSVKKLIIE